VKDFNAVFVHNLESLEVECLPTDLPERIDVDISGLERPGDGLRVKDVVVSDKLRLLDDPDTMVAVATYAKVEEEVAAVVPGAEAAVAAPTEPELAVERGKKEEEAPEE
jgi:large subunit ribosomal protein L25